MPTFLELVIGWLIFDVIGCVIVLYILKHGELSDDYEDQSQ